VVWSGATQQGGGRGCGSTHYCSVGCFGAAAKAGGDLSLAEPANRVERARIILAYLDEPSAYGVAQRMGLTQQTVKRCLERAAELGMVAALDDRARRGRDPAITAEARAWLVALAFAEPTQFGYPHGPGGARGQAAQGALLSGSARSRLRAENGGDSVRLP
jgi:hypothetical protein